MINSKGPSSVIRKGRFVVVDMKAGKLNPKTGQQERIVTLRQRRAERVKEALSTASSHSTLFRTSG